MAVPANRRPLPSIPPQVQQGRYPSPATLRGPPHSSADMYAQNSPYYSDYPYAAPFSFAYPDAGPSSPPMGMSAPPLSSLPGGTILHRGFYDLLSLIPTTSPNRLWRAQPQPPKEEVKAIRYEEMQEGRTVVPRPGNYGPPLPPVPLKKGRKVNKDMVSHPTGFIHLVHASTSEQAEALLTRWGPDNVGKLGSPGWANAIKAFIRNQTHLRAVARLAEGYGFGMGIADNGSTSDHPGGLKVTPPLRVVNGMSTPTATTSPTSAGSATSGPLPPSPTDTVQPGRSEPGSPGTIRIAPPLPSPPVGAYSEAATSGTSSSTAPLTINSDSRAWLRSAAGRNLLSGIPLQPEATIIPSYPSAPSGQTQSTIPQSPKEEVAYPRKPIKPSLTTLDRAISAKIYFENLYFPLLRLPPPREVRRLALEKDLASPLLKLSEEEKEMVRQRWKQNETEYLRERRMRVGPEAFKRVKIIGHGAFGVVSLVRERESGKLYAMKQLRKTDMLRKGQEGHVRAERDVLKAAASVPPSAGGPDWIVRLHYSFQDADHLYLVLEFMGGGDLLNLLIERDVFEEDFARFYIAEMVLAIEQCHKQGFIHRDIKPDNFLFDPEGHIKLSDFGLATDLHWAHDTSYYEQQRRDLLHKHGIDLEDGNAPQTGTKRMDRKDVERIMGGGDETGGVFTWREKNRKKLAYSVCGTNSYMSPEVIRGNGYTFSCDWWSLGVIMFECLYGYPPFVSSSRHVTRQKILNWRQSLRFPSRPRVSHEGVNLMELLLCEPEDRLGSQGGSAGSRPNSYIMQARRSGFIATYGSSGSVDGAEHIKAHPWFRNIDWNNIHQQQPPFRPELQDPEDTRYFDQDIPAEPLAPANGAAPDATRDPMLRHKVLGAEILDNRKALAFAGFTHKAPRPVTYARLSRLYPQAEEREQEREQREPGARNGDSTIRRSRALSM